METIMLSYGQVTFSDMLFIKGLIANLLTKGQTVLDYLTLPQ